MRIVVTNFTTGIVTISGVNERIDGRRSKTFDVSVELADETIADLDNLKKDGVLTYSVSPSDDIDDALEHATVQYVADVLAGAAQSIGFVEDEFILNNATPSVTLSQLPINNSLIVYGHLSVWNELISRAGKVCTFVVEPGGPNQPLDPADFGKPFIRLRFQYSYLQNP